MWNLETNEVKKSINELMTGEVGVIIKEFWPWSVYFPLGEPSHALDLSVSFLHMETHTYWESERGIHKKIEQGLNIASKGIFIGGEARTYSEHIEGFEGEIYGVVGNEIYGGTTWWNEWCWQSTN